MKHVRALIERLRSGPRPPTGPLTTTEQANADEARRQASLADGEGAEHQRDDPR
jgi:hypothetical protein